MVENVRDSVDIYKSENIDDCARVAFSENVSGSTEIIYSKEVFDSYQINKCEGIISSLYIFNSKDISFSYAAFNSARCSSIAFSQELENCHHCIFCFGLKDAEYMLFNKPIDKWRFKHIWVELIQRAQAQEFNFFRFNLEKIEVVPFFSFFLKIDDNFWRWVKSLPHFQEMVLYNITYLKDILTY